MGNPLFEVFLWCRGVIEWLQAQQLSIGDLILNSPRYYAKWWLGLYEESPLHLIIETGLICFILWLTFIRKTVDPTKSSKNDKLNDKEVEWLVETWEPEPLVPSLTSKQKAIVDSRMIVEGVKGDYFKIRGVDRDVLNLSSFDFLGLSRHPRVKTASKEALEKYGCGSCGPRGFYGTIDQHIFLEEAIATFMGTAEAICYSDSASAVSSAIPAFAKKGDLVLVDEACCEPILTGINLSRSTLQRFKHNDMADLESILQAIADDDVRLRRNAKEQRRFIVTEGLFRNTGDLCPLPEILALKERYKYRLILDETLSFGTTGATGKGVTEHFGINIADVEIITISMDTTLASIGGICIGSREIVDHQRLSGAGYCFSASSPPFLSAACTESLKIMQESPELLQKLRENAVALADGIKTIPGLLLRSADNPQPVMHVTLAPELGLTREQEEALVMRIARMCVILGTGVSTNKFSLVESGANGLVPSIRICSSAHLTKAQIESAIANLREATAVSFDDSNINLTGGLARSSKTSVSSPLSILSDGVSGIVGLVSNAPRLIPR